MIKKYKLSEYAKLNGVTYRTVWNWIQENKIEYEKTPTGGNLVVVEENDLNVNNEIAIYARVSSNENKSNLEKQKDRLISYANAKGYKVNHIITEIGSGLNDNRPKLEKLLLNEKIKLIIIEHKDRLARFGLNYIEKLLSLQNRKIEIINTQETEENDLMQDFISIITSFTARLYGKRRSKRKTEKIISELNAESN